MKNINNLQLLIYSFEKQSTPSNDFTTFEEFGAMQSQEPVTFFQQYLVYSEDDETEGYYTFTRYSSMQLIITEEFHNHYQLNYAYCHPASLNGIERFIDQAAYSNSIQYEKVKNYIARFATQFREGSEFLIIEQKVFPVSVGEISTNR